MQSVLGAIELQDWTQYLISEYIHLSWSKTNWSNLHGVTPSSSYRQPAQLDNSHVLYKLRNQFQGLTPDMSRSLENALWSVCSGVVAIPTPLVQFHQARRPRELDHKALSQSSFKCSALLFIPKRKLLFQPDLQFLLFLSLNTDKMRDVEAASQSLLQFWKG